MAAYFIFQSSGSVPAAVYEARDRCVKGVCPPNVRSYGYYPTRWRQWTGATYLPEVEAAPEHAKPEIVPSPKPDVPADTTPKPLEEDGAPALPKDVTKPETPADQTKPFELPPSETPGSLPPSLMPNSVLPGGAMPDTLLPPGLGPTGPSGQGISPIAPEAGGLLPGVPAEKKDLTSPATGSPKTPATGPDDAKKPKDAMPSAAEKGKSAAVDRYPELRAPENNAGDLLQASAASALAERTEGGTGKWTAPRNRPDSSNKASEMPGWEPSPFKPSKSTKPLSTTGEPVRAASTSTDSLRWGATSAERGPSQAVVTVSGSAAPPVRKIEPSKLRPNPLRSDKPASSSRAANRDPGANPLR
jgi:hypothetical protein